ncbi:MAG: hypothetical protein Q9220_004444 [cf. Caloplaca sp. 1 TL-2023]
MSGTNPFRRKDTAGGSQPAPYPVADHDDPVDRAALRFPTIDTTVPKSTKTKTVRIISPHYSRSKDSYDVPDITSPPPQNSFDFPSFGSDSPSPSGDRSSNDPFSAQSDEAGSVDSDEDLRRNTLANAGPATVKPPLDLKLPVNPARKAPALHFGGDAAISGSREESHKPASASSTIRPQYDVDEFKRLLLTGEKIQGNKTASTTPPIQGQFSQIGDSNSNTDASSVSRQSIFEPQTDTHHESPRTSIELPPSDDERHALVGSSSPSTARRRPPIPVSRHGKLVKQNMPLTVSFESLSSFPPGHSIESEPFLQTSSPLSPTDTHKLNKPLPPPPRSESPTPIELLPDSFPNTEADPGASVAPHQHTGPETSKQSPPAIPAARRHGQGRSRSSTNDSSRSTSLSEDFSQRTNPSSSNSLSTIASNPPPLPPPRRAGTAPAHENLYPSSGTGSTSDTHEGPAFKARPPASPSRTPSTTSIKRLSRVSTNSGSSGIAPPPPPPPRRRGSSQGQVSFTPSRLSGEYRIPNMERPRTGSGASSTQLSSAIETQEEGNDLVADLAALQREVDELRGKFGR